jgi:hypothetical protein
MITALVLSGLLAVPSTGFARPAAQDPDPAIRLTLSEGGTYAAGSWARVHVRAARDGYLLVVQSDPQGRVRVLFPVDPVDDPFIPGQRDFEIRGRGDREAFQVESDLGTGVVIAAWSPDAFHFDEFRRGERWDLRALEIPAAELDLERGLTDIVTRMAPAGGFDFDVLRYSVLEDSYASVGTTYLYSGSPTCFDCYPWRSSIYVSIGGWYDPWWSIYPSFYYPAYHYPYYPYYPYNRYYPYYSYYPAYHYPNYPSYPYYPYPGAGDRNRYGWKNSQDAVATDRPDYRDRYASGFRDRGVGTAAATPAVDTRRRLPSIAEREREQQSSVGGRRRTTDAATPAPTRGVQQPSGGRRATPAPSSGGSQAEQPSGGRRATPAPSSGGSQAEQPSGGRRATPAPSSGGSQAEQPSGGRRATPAPSTGGSRESSGGSGATRRRSASAEMPVRATGRQVDSRRQADLPVNARAYRGSSSEGRAARPATARAAEPRRVERSAAAPRVATRGSANPGASSARRAVPARAESRPQQGSRPSEARAASRPSSPAPSASRGGSSGGSRQAAPSGGGGSRGGAARGGGGGGGGGRRR